MIFYLFLIFLFTRNVLSEKLTKLELRIPGYTPYENDEYVTTIFKAEPGYIVEFEPVVDISKVHHLVIYGCTKSASNASFLKVPYNCEGDIVDIYGWAKNSPGLKLPNDVGFSIGHPNDPIQYIGLQAHYAKPTNESDFSGINLYVQNKKPKFFAKAFIFMGFGHAIPPANPYFRYELGCKYEKDVEIFPFAFRVHTHALGKMVSGYVNHDGNWTIIGRENPQAHDEYQIIKEKLIIKKNDYLLATCEYDSSNKTEVTYFGSKNTDEMCNFFIMYYQNATLELDNKPICEQFSTK